jgi:uncharacterized protein YjbI with pentapeptide repeats
MRAALDGRRPRSARLATAFAAAAAPVLVWLAIGPATAATAASCAPGSGINLTDQRITGKELARLKNTTALECADFAGADLSKLSLVHVDLANADLSSANLSHTDLAQAQLSGAVFAGAELRSTDLTRATMTGANLAGADLTSAKLGQAQLQGADLASADLRSAVLDNATLSRADLASADLRSAVLDNATLTRADLASADLTGAALTRVQAKNADFRSANLSNADFTDAILTGGNFDGANLAVSSFSGAIGAPASSTIVAAGTKSGWQIELLAGAAVIFALMALRPVRRYVRPRTAGGFVGGPSPAFASSGAGFGTWSSGLRSATKVAAPEVAAPAAAEPPAPAAVGRADTRRLATALGGALILAAGLWLLGWTIIDAILVPAGQAGFRVCETVCGFRVSGVVPVLVIAVLLMISGVTLRILGRIRS